MFLNFNVVYEIFFLKIFKVWEGLLVRLKFVFILKILNVNSLKVLIVNYVNYLILLFEF